MVTGGVSLSRQTVRGEGPDNTAMNWKYLLGCLTVLWSGCAGEEERMCREGEGWCDDPLYYPHHVINNINSSHPLWSHLTQGTEHKHPKHHKHHPKHPDFLTSQQVCPTLESFIVPRAGRNKNKEWRFILNSEDSRPEYQQVVSGDDIGVRTVDIQVIKVGECEHTESCHGAWAGHETQCLQLYLEHKLVAITQVGKVLIDSFLFPSCCSCHVVNKIPIE